jgi:hypothetical protein
MTTIDREHLSAVSGGGESTSKTTTGVNILGTQGSVTRETRTTDNESCRRDVKAACDATNRGLFGVDRARAGQCFLENFPSCPR